MLVTTSKKFAKAVKDEDMKGYIVLARNLEQAVEVINRIAPEHLEILIKRPNRILKKIQNAGAIFTGPYSPVCIGDYVAGPSHILPTGGTARFFSGLGVRSFLKSIHTISYSKKALEKEKVSIEKITKYTRKRTLQHFKCNKCSIEFTRPKNGKLPQKTDSHYCDSCKGYAVSGALASPEKHKKYAALGPKA